MKRPPASVPSSLRYLALAGIVVAVACSSTTPSLSVDVTVGQEASAFTMDPPVVRVDIAGTSIGGADSVSATAAPGATFDLGDVSLDDVMQFQVTGLDASGNTVLRGLSPPIVLSGIQGTLPVFAERVDQWARPPGGLPAPRVGGVPWISYDTNSIALAGGTGGSGPGVSVLDSDGYALDALSGVLGTNLPFSPQTVVVSVTADALLLIASDRAAWVSATDGTVTEVDLSATGLTSFADVAGGQPVITDGPTYVVGATRSATATRWVLVVPADPTIAPLSALQLTSPRVGAAAVPVSGVGLVVAGGSATAPGVEVLGATASAFATLGYPADPVQGAGAVSTSLGVVLMGGTRAGVAAPTRVVQTSCLGACTAKVLPGGATVPLASASAYNLGPQRAVAVGADLAKPPQTRAFLLDFTKDEATELPFREPRRGASVTPTQDGTLAVLGGLHLDGTPALSLEMLYPQ